MKGFETSVAIKLEAVGFEAEEHRPAMKGFETNRDKALARVVVVDRGTSPRDEGVRDEGNTTHLALDCDQRNIAPR